CAICLGRQEHDYKLCNKELLWDGSKGHARRTSDKRLINSEGQNLCFQFQLPNGCRSNTHPDKHRCS
ncbi:hypothetical protein FA15DRAFT_553227, partial [Coprinopsis marcescibilis]